MNRPDLEKKLAKIILATMADYRHAGEDVAAGHAAKNVLTMVEYLVFRDVAEAFK